MTTTNNQVDWQISKTKVKQRGEYLLETGTWSDCSFIVGLEPHQQIINGHKLFLAMSSPVFEAMFFGPIAEKNDQPIPILDVQPKAFKALLQYIYTDQINLNSFDQACELCYGGKKYMLPHLVVECTRYLWSDLNPKNVCRAYEFAKLFEEPNLMDKCLQIICTQTQEVLSESSFEDVELSTLTTIYSQENLMIDSELDLFNALVKYTTKHASGSMDVSADSTKSNTPAPENASTETNATTENSANEPQNNDTPENNNSNSNSTTIRDVLKNIRFLTMTPQQFADGPALSDLLTKTEKFEILMNMSSDMGTTPMPEGFSTSKKQRKTNGKTVPFDRLSNGSCSSTSGVNPMLNTIFTPMTQPTRPELMENHIYGVDSNNSGYPIFMRERGFSDISNRNENPRFGGIVPGSARIDTHPSFTGFIEDGGNSSSSNVISTVQQPQQIDEYGGNSNDEMSMRNMPKYFCTRPIVQKTESLNRSVFDCAVTFNVDRNICILGIEVAAQVLQHVGTYSELLYAHLVDADGSRLTYLHYTARVQYRSIIELMFYRPVYIQRNKDYKVVVVFNRHGWYPFGTSPPSTTVRGVTFNFNDEMRDGLIRSIIFSY